ncbi:unnamed protein product [Cunninghamella echinulata]
MSIDPTAYADPSYFKFALQNAMIVGIGGGAQASKFQICEILKNKFGGDNKTKVAILSLNDYYRELTTPEEKKLFDSGEYNLDHPDAFDFDLLESTLKSLLQRQPVDIPVWDHSKHQKIATRRIEAVDIILLEGTLILYSKKIRDLMFMKVFVDVDSDQRLISRVKKLTEGDGRIMSIKDVLNEYVNFVKPMFDEFIAPSKKYSDIIIPRGYKNTAALQVLEHHLDDHLRAQAKNSSSSMGRTESNDTTGSSIPTIKHHHTDILASSAESKYKDIPE